MEIKPLKTAETIEVRKFGNKSFLLNKLFLKGLKIPDGILLSNKKICTNSLMKKLKSNKFIKNNKIFCLRVSKIEKNLISPSPIFGLGINETYIDKLSSENEKLYFYKLYIKLIEEFSIYFFDLNPKIYNDVSNEYFKINKNTSTLHEKIKCIKNVLITYKKIFAKNSNVKFPDNKFSQIEIALRIIIGFEDSQKKEKFKIYNLNNYSNKKIDTLMPFGIIIQNMLTLKESDKIGFGNYHDVDLDTGNNRQKFIFFENFLNLDNSKKNTKRNEIENLKFKNNLKNTLREINNIVIRTLKERYKIEFFYSYEDIYIVDVSLPNRSINATLKIINCLIKKDIISPKEAILKIDPYSLVDFLHPKIDPKSSGKSIGHGLSASPGAAKGHLAFNKKDAFKYTKKGKKVIFVSNETSPKDIYTMKRSEALITLKGGLTSHAAVIARGLGLPCIVGVKDFRLNYKKKLLISQSGKKFKSGDFLTIDGTSGNIFFGNQETIFPKNSKSFDEIMKWVDHYKKIDVRANADTEDDIKIANRYLADGIGLCRSEHMFLEKNRLLLFQKMILSKNKEIKKKCLETLMQLHQKDLKKLFDAVGDKPFAIRLFDSPLNEFFSNTKKEKNRLFRKFDINKKNYKETLENIGEYNPMLGKRGVRLGLTEQEIYEMQIRAIFCALSEINDEKNTNFSLEVILPMVSSVREIKPIKKMIFNIKKLVEKKFKNKIYVKFGVMIETPRSALISEDIAPFCDFFNYGTNDLTQMVYGLSRDDKSQFIEYYNEKNLFGIDPFSSIDQKGVGKLIESSLKKAKRSNDKLFVGVCGEHGGDPVSISFFSNQKFDYISCSPYRIPIAKLAAAQSNIILENREKGIEIDT